MVKHAKKSIFTSRICKYRRCTKIKTIICSYFPRNCVTPLPCQIRFFIHVRGISYGTHLRSKIFTSYGQCRMPSNFDQRQARLNSDENIRVIDWRGSNYMSMDRKTQHIMMGTHKNLRYVTKLMRSALQCELTTKSEHYIMK